MGFSVDGIYYSVLLDEQQNVTKVFSETKEIGEYKYDAWGNCEVIPAIGISQSEDFALYNQGIRWKSYYCDAYVKCYYIAGRWYDPEIMQYLDADKIENILFLASELNSLDRNAIITDNILDFEANTDNIFTSGELFVDPTDENADKSWWDIHWKELVQWIAITATVVVTIINPAFGIASFHFTGAALLGVAIGALGGGFAYTASEGISYLATGKWSWSWGMFTGSIIGGAIGGMASATKFGLIISSGITGFSSSAIGMGLQNTLGEASYLPTQIVGTSLFFGIVSALTAGVMDKIKIPGLNKGRGSFIQVSKQIYTKFIGQQIHNIAGKTFLKMVVLNLYYNILGTFANGIFDALGMNV